MTIAEDTAPPIVASPAPDAVPMTDAVSDPERIAAIDVARGVAILGILLVNIQFFGHAFGRFLTLVPPPNATVVDVIAYYFTAIFCSGKFYPLFSLLFGIGFAIQYDRAKRKNMPFAGLYLRRLAVLAVMGLLHGFLLWYGDILFLYSLAGLLLFGALMLMPNASWRKLMLIGIAVVLFAIFITTAMGMLTLLQETPEQTLSPQEAMEAANAEAAAADSPLGRLFEGFEGGGFAEGPADPLWIALEERAYREGPYLQSLGFRAMTYAFSLIFMLFGFGWHVLGMFFIGAALMRSGFFSGERRRLQVRLIWLGLLLGLPLSVLGALMPVLTESKMLQVMGSNLTMLGGPLMSLAYLSLITLLAGNALVSRAIGSVGRMALTCYLLSTVIATAIMYHWGLGYFGQLSNAQQVLVVIGIYVGLVVLANLWLAVFRFGPLEWLWRWLTYLRPQP